MLQSVYCAYEQTCCKYSCNICSKLIAVEMFVSVTLLLSTPQPVQIYFVHVCIEDSLRFIWLFNLIMCTVRTCSHFYLFAMKFFFLFSKRRKKTTTFKMLKYIHCQLICVKRGIRRRLKQPNTSDHNYCITIFSDWLSLCDMWNKTCAR